MKEFIHKQRRVSKIIKFALFLRKHTVERWDRLDGPENGKFHSYFADFRQKITLI